MVDTYKQDYLGGVMQVMAAGTGKVIGYHKYSKYMVGNNEFTTIHFASHY